MSYPLAFEESERGKHNQVEGPRIPFHFFSPPSLWWALCVYLGDKGGLVKRGLGSRFISQEVFKWCLDLLTFRENTWPPHHKIIQKRKIKPKEEVISCRKKPGKLSKKNPKKR